MSRQQRGVPQNVVFGIFQTETTIRCTELLVLVYPPRSYFRQKCHLISLCPCYWLKSRELKYIGFVVLLSSSFGMMRTKLQHVLKARVQFSFVQFMWEVTTTRLCTPTWSGDAGMCHSSVTLCQCSCLQCKPSMLPEVTWSSDAQEWKIPCACAKRSLLVLALSCWGRWRGFSLCARKHVPQTQKDEHAVTYVGNGISENKSDIFDCLYSIQRP